jgi:hypothetical protein
LNVVGAATSAGTIRLGMTIRDRAVSRSLPRPSRYPA